MVVDVSVGAVSCFQVLDYNKWRGFGHISVDQKARTMRAKKGERHAGRKASTKTVANMETLKLFHTSIFDSV